jgi:hypothetical protein
MTVAAQVGRKDARVANFVPHNDDLDFFVVRGNIYDMRSIQQWLPLTTGTPMSSNVDNAAIAGLVELIHIQGCFGLSGRVICPTQQKKLETNPPRALAMYARYEVSGCLFEQVLQGML